MKNIYIKVGFIALVISFISNLDACAQGENDSVQTFPIAKDCLEIQDSESQMMCTQQYIMDFVLKKVEYPEIAKDNGIEGKVVIGFVIDELGNVIEAMVKQSVDPILDNQALKAVDQLPRFEPATLMGKAVRMTYAVPVNFKLVD